jgi:hypothetical protein
MIQLSGVLKIDAVEFWNFVHSKFGDSEIYQNPVFENDKTVLTVVNTKEQRVIKNLDFFVWIRKNWLQSMQHLEVILDVPVYDKEYQELVINFAAGTYFPAEWKEEEKPEWLQR